MVLQHGVRRLGFRQSAPIRCGHTPTAARDRAQERHSATFPRRAMRRCERYSSLATMVAADYLSGGGGRQGWGRAVGRRIR